MKDERELPSRKNNRLCSYDYSNIGTYFVTVCTKNRQPVLWNSLVGAINDRPQIVLSEYGKIVDEAINAIPCCYPAVLVEKYAIMPDHIHLLLRIVDTDGRSLIAPTISTVVRQLKGSVSKKCGASIWQKGFYDHVVRNSEDCEEIAVYIANNPEKWIQKHC
ncbi:MAG: transposase [Clostridia bacterium]|nr:transposase [Clostridia bacterium]